MMTLKFIDKVICMILFENVTVRRNNKEILKNINWKVKKGEHWSILGLNGSGKTSLLNAINGYMYPNEGNVTVLGQQFGQTHLGELRKKIGYISFALQEQLRGFDTILSVVLSGKYASIGLYEAVEKADVDKAYEYLKLFNIEHLAETIYGNLSHGERQRVLIARALMANPEILILDEPCNGLDLIAREELLKVISKIAERENPPTMIYVTHYVEEILPCFTHTLLMKNGEVFLSGLTKDLMKEDILSKFFDRPIGIQYEQNRAWIALKEIENSYK